MLAQMPTKRPDIDRSTQREICSDRPVLAPLLQGKPLLASAWIPLTHAVGIVACSLAQMG